MIYFSHEVINRIEYLVMIKKLSDDFKTTWSEFLFITISFFLVIQSQKVMGIMKSHQFLTAESGFFKKKTNNDNNNNKKHLKTIKITSHGN